LTLQLLEEGRLAMDENLMQEYEYSTDVNKTNIPTNVLNLIMTEVPLPVYYFGQHQTKLLLVANVPSKLVTFGSLDLPYGLFRLVITVSQAYFAIHKCLHKVQNFKEKIFFWY
jgi:hypothetical protein